jgi:hypothetical protein
MQRYSRVWPGEQTTQQLCSHVSAAARGCQVALAKVHDVTHQRGVAHLPYPVIARGD